MIIFLLFINLCLGRLDTVISDEYPLSYTLSYDIGTWSITVTKINGTSPVKFCTGTTIYPQQVSVTGQTSSIDSSIWPICYQKGQKIDLTVLGATENDSVSIQFTEVEIPVTEISSGSLFLASINTSMIFYYKFTVSGSPYLTQLVAYPDPNSVNSVAGNTYTVKIRSPTCGFSQTSVKPQTAALASSVESGVVKLCSPQAGVYIVSIESAIPFTTTSQNITLQLNTYATVEWIDLTNDTVQQFDYYKTSFLRYAPSASASPLTDYQLSISSQGNPNGYFGIRVNTAQEAYCTQSQTDYISPFLPSRTNFQNDYPTCDLLSYIYISITPTQPQNRTDGKTGNVSITVHEITPPVSSQISLDTEYNITVVEYFYVPSASIVGYGLISITGGSSTDNLEVSIRRGSPALFDGSCTVNSYDSYTLKCITTTCNYSIAFSTCQFDTDSGNFYITVNDITQSAQNLKLSVHSLPFSHNDTQLLQNAQTITGVVSRIGNSYLHYNNISPSIFRITNTGIIAGGGGSGRITARVPEPDETKCLDNNPVYQVNSPGGGGGGGGNANSLAVPVVCPNSGLILLTTQSDEVGYTAVLNQVSAVSFSDTVLNQTNISTVLGSTNILSTFTTNSSNYLTFTVQSTENNVDLRLVIFPKSSCSTFYTLSRCRNGYPCTLVTPSPLSAQEYYLAITDRAITPVNPTYNITVSFIYGNINCRNITTELNFCAGHLDPNNNYRIAVGNTIDYENSAQTIYNLLLATWSASCNMSLTDYACKSAFQPQLCLSSGDLTKTYLCASDCVSTLQTSCLNGNPVNLCESTACSLASGLITQCSNPPVNPASPNAPGNGVSLSTMFVLILLSMVTLNLF